MQIRRLCLSLKETCPEGAALEAMLANPENVLSRICRDISTPDVAVKSLLHPMQVLMQFMFPHTLEYSSWRGAVWILSTMHTFDRVLLVSSPIRN